MAAAFANLEDPTTGTRSWIAAAALPVAAGLGAAARAAWVCDDAFITFRYVDQLAAGSGLVYNPGERVEGYTHFLWLVLLAATQRAGADLVTAGRILPLVFHAATLALLFVWSLRQVRARGWFLPIAAWASAWHADLRIWASGGLETAAFTFCTTAAVLASSSVRARPGLSAALAALATLFRPEGVLVSVCAALVLAWRHRSPGAVLRFAGVWLALVAPLVAWRLAYYDAWLPNTYYAKAGGSTHWAQGWRYLSSYFMAYPILLAAPVAAAATLWRVRPVPGTILPALATAAALAFYVVRVGGDFMFARFLVPVTPLLYLVIETAIQHERRRTLAVAAAIVTLGATLAAPVTRARILAGGDRVRGIADEHAAYPPEFIDERRRQGAEMAAIFSGTPVRVCTLGSQASFAYFARFVYVFERYGLTDREFARRSLAERGRPGHERALSRRDLMERRVHFFFRGTAADRTGAIDEAIFGDLLASIVFYDRVLMDALAGRPGVAFVDYPLYLDSLVLKASGMPPEARQTAWAEADGYYFRHNADPAREARVRAALFGAANTSP